MGIGSDFLNRIQMAQKVRERTDKWDYMKLKCFCTTQEEMEWEKIFASYMSDKGLITRIYRELNKTKLSINQ
jgi:ABC-type sulfate transport system substrate-binding protein